MPEINILLVDDEHDFASTLAERLSLRGFSVETASGGESALTLFDEKRPDVVIMDVRMPGINGLATLKKMKEIDSNVRVVLLTGHGSTKEGMEGMRLGACDFLRKPIDIDELISKLKSAMECNR